ncbi:MAG TPA: multicopper oxidase domain-containing protein [Methylococcaceae bacterium]|nr:multicopper oxidase domain-containing protein [Methylococcaceae bacterium]
MTAEADGKTGEKQALAPGMALPIALCALLASMSAESKTFDIPTGAPPSPLFGAAEFSSQMLLLEEFGTRPLPGNEAPRDYVLPQPASSCSSVPDGARLDAFLGADALYPLPNRNTPEAYLGSPNPWDSRIKECVPGVAQTYMEGRPPGTFFAHQRWTEFFPEVYFQSATTGARTNNGLRNPFQRHRYSTGEFAPGGLYHLPDGTKGIEVRFHPSFPVQDPKAVWTFDGTMPPKLLVARYGEPILFRHHDALPIDEEANFGFGLHTITTHEHNGHNPAESDGYTHAFFYPGQYYDYHWPMILAGHDRTNTLAADPKAGAPDGNGGIRNVRGDWRETMSSHWFHDHMLDFTAQNVYKGMATMMNFYSALDRGREPANEQEKRFDPAKPGIGCHYADPDRNVNLCLPSGSGLDWGNRDYDVNLMVTDKAWDQNGQLFFNIFNTDGFLGDRMVVNGKWKPYFEVRARRYRFRILDAAVSRFFKIALVDEAGNRVPFHMVANDGNLMEHAVRFPNDESADLPELGIAERYDIVIDFKDFHEGDRLYFVNLLEHINGRGPKRVVQLKDVVRGTYRGDPGVGKFLEFRVKTYAGTDLSMNPADYEEGRKKMIPLPVFTAAELQSAKHRSFVFGRKDVDVPDEPKPWVIKTDGGAGLPPDVDEGFNMDPHRLSAAPDEGTTEIWHLKTGGGWSHPVHIHFEEGQILLRDGKIPPAWERFARKDVYRVGDLAPDSGKELDLALRFREFMGSYMEHCHNTQHEDKAMLLRWDVQNPGQTINLPTPMPDWSGVVYEDTFTLPTFKTGDVKAAEDFEIPDSIVFSARVTQGGMFRVEGTVNPFQGNKGATMVSLFNGLTNEGICDGVPLGQVKIKQGKGNQGTFEFHIAEKKLLWTPETVCAALSVGNVAKEAAVQQR